MCIVKHDDHFSAWKDARAYVSNLPTTDVSLRNRTSPIGGTPVDTACFERGLRSRRRSIHPGSARRRFSSHRPSSRLNTGTGSQWITRATTGDDCRARASKQSLVCRNIIAVVVTVPGVETTPRAPFVRVPCEVSAARRAFFREESPATRASRGHAALVRLNPAWSRFVLADARRLGPPPRAVPSTSPPPPSR